MTALLGIACEVDRKYNKLSDDKYYIIISRTKESAFNNFCKILRTSFKSWDYDIFEEDITDKLKNIDIPLSTHENGSLKVQIVEITKEIFVSLGGNPDWSQE